jgi:alkylation response protein AidB-like acyl-CoA dehydrogenase
MRTPFVSIGTAFHEMATTCGATLPLPGSGNTGRRFEMLGKWAASDLSLGRLIEGHADALAILAEAGRKPAEPEATYGVWAARTGTGGTTATREPGGRWRLGGLKPFCSGNRIVERALVTADSPDGYLLFDIAVRDNVVGIEERSWQAIGMADSQSDTVEIGGPPVKDDQIIGHAGFYLERPGFWFGACGVAACWYGGARGLVTTLTDSIAPTSSQAVLAELGHAIAHVEAMQDILEHAASVIDADPDDVAGRAQHRAMVVRHAVRYGATQVMGHTAAAAGARPLCHDAEQARRAADLYVYLAQHHGPQDAAEIGRLAIADRP